MRTKNNGSVRYYTQLSDRIFMFFVVAFCLFCVAVIAVPLIFVVAASFSSPSALLSGRVFLLPVEPTLRGYKMLLEHDLLVSGFLNSILYTTVGTLVNVTLTVLAAYPLSRSDFKARKIVMILFTITMLFNGGMIPTYLQVKNLGLLDSMWAVIFPTAISTWNLIITKTFFQTTIPSELYDSAWVDGCDDAGFLFRICLPLSRSIIAVNVLLYAVGHWNSYFNEMIYLNTNKKYPLQLVLREILVNMNTGGMTMDVVKQLERQQTKYLLQYSSIVIGTVPVMLLYPLVQKHFVKGILVGAVKG